MCPLVVVFPPYFQTKLDLFAHYSTRKTQLTCMVATDEMTEIELCFHYFLAEIT